MTSLFVEQVALKRVAAVGFLAIGAAGVGVSAQFLSAEAPAVAKWYAALAAAGIAPGNTVTAIQIILAGGIVGLVAGLAAALASTRPGSRVAMWAAVALAFASGVLMIALGAAVSSNPFGTVVGPDAYVANLNKAASSENPAISGQKALMQLFGLAVYNKCCLPRGWGAQTLFASCGTTCPSAASGDLTDSRIDIIRPLVDITKLCTCVPSSSQADYNTIAATISNSTCSDMNKIRITFYDDMYIPTTTVKTGLLRTQLFPKTTIIRIPVVGYNLDPALDPEQGTEVGYGFGCGLGYPKGVMWFQEIYYRQYIEPMGTKGVGCGAAMLGFSVFIVLASAFIVYSEHADETKQDWENTLAANWNQPTTTVAGAGVETKMSGAQVPQQAPVYAQQAPTYAQQPQPGGVNYAVQNPQFSYAPTPAPGSVGVPLAGAPVDPALMKRVAEFYRQYDTKKTEADVTNIVRWAQQNGVNALNKKLRDKYGADLDGGGPPI